MRESRRMLRPWLGLMALTLACSFAAPSAAQTLGAGGVLGDVDLIRKTVEVGKYTLKVTNRSVLRDAHGQRITLRELDRLRGEAGVRLLDGHGGYILQELQMVGLEEDDPAIDAPAAPTNANKPGPHGNGTPAKRRAR